ncbi:MAG: class 1 fructose-bisphosphatase [Halodesulfurarchaeum sp.]
MTISAVFDVLTRTAPELRAGLAPRRTRIGEENVTGDPQLQGDVWADGLFAERMAEIDGVGEYASEEREEVIDTGSGYSVSVDPLDGSSNLKSNNPMGTIVGIYDADLPAPGRDLVAAGFILYGPITTLVVARDGIVSEYIVTDGNRKEGRRIMLPEEPTVYGFGGRVPDWTPRFSEYVSAIESRLKLRYGGAMIADVNQVLTYGGIYGYPALESRPEGKLRLLFEGSPMGYIVETAGGASSDGERSLLDIEPESLHHRTPLFVGNQPLIDELEATMNPDIRGRSDADS